MPFEHDADGIFEGVKSYVERGLKPLLARIYGIEKQIAELPAPVNGEDGAEGAAGKDGRDGRNGINGERGADGAEGSAGPQGPEGKAGRDGKDGRDGINGKDGERGADGLPGALGAQGAEGKAGPAGRDGTDGFPGKDGAPGEKGGRGFDGKDGADGLAGKDGRDGINGKDGSDGLMGKDGDPGRDGRDGMAGPPGRDALQIEPLPAIDSRRSYPRGTYALAAGGTLRAMRTTDPFEGAGYEAAGWAVIQNGISGGEFTLDGRTLTCSLKFTAGAAMKTFHIPVQIYRGVWKEQEYEEGDTVTSAGSNWHANRVTRSRPGTDDGWTLMTKRGSDGKDGR